MKRDVAEEKSVSIRFPLALLEEMKRIAKQHNRSLNKEVITVLQNYAKDSRQEGEKRGV